MTDKAIIIGGAGFIGTNLAISAIEKGYEVIIFDDLSRGGADLNLKYIEGLDIGKFSFIKGDICKSEDVYKLFKDNKDCSVIFHLAAQVAVTFSVEDPRNDFNINAFGTLNVLESIRKLGISAPLLYSSTNKVYGKMENVEVSEHDSFYNYKDLPFGVPESFPLEFYSPYGCSKGSADQYVLDYSRIFGLKTVVFRQSCIYGYNQFGIEDQGWVAWFTIAALFGKPITIFGNGKQVRDVLFINDLVSAFWEATKKIEVTNGQAYNIGGGPNFKMSLLQLLKYLENSLGRKIDLDYDEFRPGDQMVYISDIRKADKEFGWKPEINPEMGVQKIVEWSRSNKNLFVESGIIN